MKLNEPFFSICIPNYNYGRFIGTTIESVLAQTYQNFEIIVADNASTDNSVAVVNSFDDPRIRLYENNYNIGFAPNLQRATVHARGDFIHLLSSDDLMKPRALEAYIHVIRQVDEPHNLILYSDVEYFDNQGNITSYRHKADDGHYLRGYQAPPPAELTTMPQDGRFPYHLYQGREVLADSLGRLHTFASFLSIIYSRRLWEAVEGYNAVRTIGPDKFFNFKLLAQNPIVAYVPLILFKYRDFESPNRAALQSTIKQQIDDYLYTIEYREPELVELGLSRRRLIHTFLDRMCLDYGFYFLSQRNYWHAVRLLAFALASYPQMTLLKPKAYALMALLATGPLSLVLAPWLLNVRKQRYPDRYQ